MKQTDVIFFCGQSNMQGQSDTLSECRAVAGALEYKYFTDSLVPLKNPVGENLRYNGGEGWTIAEGQNGADWRAEHALGAACYGHTNLVPAFCRAYLTHSQAETVVAVHVAKGATQVHEWLPSTRGYDALMLKAHAALARVKQQYDVRHIYLAWLQGESDAIFGVDKETYKARLKELEVALRTALGIQAFGIIRVGKFTNDARDWEIIHAQDEICREDTAFLMLTDCATALNDQPEHMHPRVAGHYSAKGLEYLGNAAGTTLGQYTKTQEDIQ